MFKCPLNNGRAVSLSIRIGQCAQFIEVLYEMKMIHAVNYLIFLFGWLLKLNDAAILDFLDFSLHLFIYLFIASQFLGREKSRTLTLQVLHNPTFLFVFFSFLFFLKGTNYFKNKQTKKHFSTGRIFNCFLIT